MKVYKKIIPFLALAGIIASSGFAQVQSGSGVRRRSDRDKKKTESATPGVTERMQDFYEDKPTHDADLEYMRQIYRQIDLTKDANTPLYFPEDVVDGQQNLFRLILSNVVNGKIPAYEYLDGREVFTDQYRVNVPEMLDRFGIYYTSSGSGKNPVITIEEADVPTGQVLNYYILEKWEFDRRSNQMKTRVEAICPVLNKISDFGGDTRYPMFWVKYDALRPFLAGQYIFLTDDNNLPQYSLDDYFNLGMYDGEIYKTRNLRHLSMNQMYPDPDDLKHAQDSIDKRLKEYGKHLWVPTREEYLAQKEREEEARIAAEKGDTLSSLTVVEEQIEQKRNTRRVSASSTKKSTKKRAVKKSSSVKSSSSSSNSNAAKSVRRRKK